MIFASAEEEAAKVLWWKHWYDRPPSDWEANIWKFTQRPGLTHTVYMCAGVYFSLVKMVKS